MQKPAEEEPFKTDPSLVMSGTYRVEGVQAGEGMEKGQGWEHPSTGSSAPAFFKGEKVDWTQQAMSLFHLPTPHLLAHTTHSHLSSALSWKR